MQIYQGTLIIKPSAGRLTHDTEIFSKMDPYVKVTCGQQTQSTRFHKNGGKNPTWTDSLTFNIRGEDMIQFDVHDKDDFGKDDWVGNCSISMTEVATKQSHSNWYNLSRKGKSSGQIMIQFEFHNTGQKKDKAGKNQMGMGMQQPMGMQQMGMQQMGMQQMGMQPMGMQPMGMQQQPMGMQPMGMQQQPMGMQQMGMQPMGMHQQPMGMQPMGMQQQPMGMQQQPMGMQQQPMGYHPQQQPMGYPPQQQPMGYPPMGGQHMGGPPPPGTAINHGGPPMGGYPPMGGPPMGGPPRYY